MGSLRQRRVLSSVTVKRRKSWLLAASALAPLSLGVSEPVLGQQGCTSTPSATVCTSDGNSYPGGINVNTTNLLNGFANSINLQLLSGVNVDIPPAQAALTPSTPLIAGA
jgi:hypothetical protein